MPKVLISDELSPRAVDIFRERGIDVDMQTGLKPDQLRTIIGDYDGLAIRSATKVTKELLEVAHALKVVGRAGIGVDNVDIPAATARGVVVMNTPYGNSITTAEHAIAMMFALARDIPQANISTHAGKWEKSRFMGVELTGKVLGIVGCGNIGSIVADRALGLKMKVVAYDPFLTPERATDLGVEKVELDELLARADFITLHTPLTDQTRGVIDARALGLTRPGVRIINCARGGLIDEAALKAAIESGHVAGAALDVFAVEPAKENALFALDQVVCTPHLGASTSEAQENVALQVAEQMADFLLQGAVINAVNMPSLSAEDAPKLRPYLQLAEQLGSFAGQITDSGITSITIEYEGHVAALNLRPLTAVILKGLLSTRLETVNMVNAPVVAKQNDIKVTESRCNEAAEYQTAIRVIVNGGANGGVSVMGTLFSDKPRVVAIDGVPTEAELTPHMLLIENLDKPGFIGSLGRTLGDGQINIAAFHNGRTAPGGRALCLVSVDQRIDETLKRRIGQLPNVVRVRDLTF
jgi:D-3-phosphoglycerate dehydrogenase